MKKKPLRFIDLFAGLGGFHIAMQSVDTQAECVFVSELREDLRKLYKINHDVPEEMIFGDITQVDFKQIPQHDVLCAGFPCQPFSQAGKRQGFDDEKERGNMFNYICKIIEAQGENKPKYLILENVSNLMGHDGGNTWKVIKERLSMPVEKGGLDYEVDAQILSPHQFGYPQHRKRIYIVGVRRDMGGLKDFHFPEPTNAPCNIKDIIDENDTEILPLSFKTHMHLKVWQKFLDNCKKENVPVPGFPIWAMEFGATYPFESFAPAYIDKAKLIGERGKLGRVIEGTTHEECLKQLPIYSQNDKSQVFPEWKIRYIHQNRTFYTLNKGWLDKWLPLIDKFDNSHMKLEWNCGSSIDYKIKDKIVQFRASGIRVKAPTFSPALNLVGTQVPIVPWVRLPKECIPEYTKEELAEFGLTPRDVQYGRYMSTRECAKLQGMDALVFGNQDFKLSNTRIYEALGNAINTQVVVRIAKNLLKI